MQKPQHELFNTKLPKDKINQMSINITNIDQTDQSKVITIGCVTSNHHNNNN